MAYLGNTPVAEYYDSKTEQYSGDGNTTIFTLSRQVATANDVEVIVNNVQQDPYTAFTASGTTLTFTEAPTSGSGNILVTYRNYLLTRLIPNAQSVTESMIEDGAITSAKIAPGTVIAADILDGTIDNNKLVTANITGSKLVANTITAREIADNAILANNIVNNIITGDKIASATIGSSNLTSTGVSAGNYGGTSNIPVITVDAQGRVSYAANVILSAANTPFGTYSYIDKDGITPNGYVAFTDTVYVNANTYPSLAAVSPTSTQYDTSNAAATGSIIKFGAKGSAQFGYSVAVEGNYLVIGNYTNSNVANVEVYNLTSSGWSLQQTILDPSSNTSNSYFGGAVAIDIGSIYGDSILIGAENAERQGRAYRYVRTGSVWNLANTYSGNSSIDGTFGNAVAIANNYVLIGAQGALTAYGYLISSGNSSPARYFTAVTSGGPSSAYGSAVGIFNNGRALVCAANEDLGGPSRQGALYYYPNFANSPRILAIKPGGEPTAGDNFGNSISTQKNGTIFITGADGWTTSKGYVTVFNVASNTVSSEYVQLLSNPSNQTSSNFGKSLKITANGTIIIGSPNYDGANTNQGRAYIYLKSNANGAVTLTANIENPSPQTNDYFGQGVSIANTPNTFIVSAYGKDDTANGRTDAGLVYINGFQAVVLNPLPTSSSHKTLVRIS